MAFYILVQKSKAGAQAPAEGAHGRAAGTGWQGAHKPLLPSLCFCMQLGFALALAGAIEALMGIWRTN